MTKVKLTIRERLGMMKLFNDAYAQKGLDVTGLRVAGEIGAKCEMTKKEKKAINWQDMGPGQAQLDGAKAEKIIIEVTFTDSELDMIASVIKAKNDMKGFTGADMFVLEFMEKLQIVI